jgi:GNAT superfamily N-acetyltransferase
MLGHSVYPTGGREAARGLWERCLEAASDIQDGLATWSLGLLDVHAGTPADALERLDACRARMVSGGLPAVTETLALAFYDDPVVSWCVEDGSRRRQLNPAVFGAVAESYLAYNETYAVDEGISTALWAPPGAADDEELPGLLGEILEDAAERLFKVFGLMAETHPVEPHYYLFLLGTRPEWQGRGLGSSLMAPVLQTCDRDRVPAYLEATSERNVPLYLRHGFDVTADIQVPGGQRMWPMWRTPK